jgi:hypothetical protein
MRTTPTTSAFAAAAIALTLLAGCSSGGSGPTDDGTLTWEDSPLSAYWDKIGGGEQDQAAADAEFIRSEEIVAACMQEEGFEYTPDEPSRFVATSDDDTDDGMPEYDSLEYAEQYGYGATTYSEMPGNDEADEYVDPNADYLATMSETEQEAFYAALYGPDTMSEETTDEEAEEEYEYDWTKAGCQGKAQHEVYEEGDIYNDPEFKDLFDAMNDFYEDSQKDERFLAAFRDWSECMAEAGYDFGNPTEASQSIYDLVNEIPYDEATGEQDPAALAEIRDDEIATATADRKCQDSTGAMDKALKAQFAVEQDFVDAHKAELDAMVEKASQADKK